MLRQAVMRVTSTGNSLASVGHMGRLTPRVGQEVRSYLDPRMGEDQKYLMNGTNN